MASLKELLARVRSLRDAFVLEIAIKIIGKVFFPPETSPGRSATGSIAIGTAQSARRFVVL